MKIGEDIIGVKTCGQNLRAGPSKIKELSQNTDDSTCKASNWLGWKMGKIWKSGWNLAFGCCRATFSVLLLQFIHHSASVQVIMHQIVRSHPCIVHHKYLILFFKADYLRGKKPSRNFDFIRWLSIVCDPYATITQKGTNKKWLLLQNWNNFCLQN